MAALTPTSLLKSQLNLDHNFDDALLAHKLEAAETWISRYIGEPYVAGEAPLTEAALQLAAYWYEQREAASFGMTTAHIPFGVRDLLSPYKNSVTGYVQE